MYSTPKEIYKAHPIFGWVLSPNSQIQVSYRPGTIQNTNSNSDRVVTNKTQKTNHNLNIYGCSFTYGTGLKDDETYSSILQNSLPDFNITNKGIGGHSTVQNYLRFREDIKTGQVDSAVFGVISDHRYRNIPHPYRMKQHLKPAWYDIGVEHIPHIHIDRNKKPRIKFTPIWQECMLRDDFGVFVPDEYYLDLATIVIFQEILKLASKNDIPVKFALLDQLDEHFSNLMLSEFSETIDVSTPQDNEHSFQPIDLHPNQRANQYFADRILKELRNFNYRAI